MFSCFGWLLVAIVGTGCHSLAALELPDDGPSAEVLWEKGQAAMRQGQPARAVNCYQQSLAKAPDLTRNHLSLAAAHLELGEQAQACIHLAAYVKAHPEELVVHVQYAELLLRLHRDRPARVAFEHCISAAQEQGEQATRHLIHCHSRLMEIAESHQDVYGEHLHRGIGLYLLARQSAGLAEVERIIPSEGLYCKAAGELTLALEERPEEARPSWYLYAVWSRLAQRQPALRCLNEAGAAAPFSYLTPAEQRDLALANQEQDPAGLMK